MIALANDVAPLYRQAVRTHEAALAGRLRVEARLLTVASPGYARLERTLEATRNPLRPWPLASEVAREAPAGAARGDAATALASVVSRSRAGDRRGAVVAGLTAYALDPTDDFGVLVALDRRAGVSAAVTAAQQARGDVSISHATVVSDAAIIVFREGLEAVLILAALTASLSGRLRRAVLAGGLAGLLATGMTWLLAQVLVSELGTGGLRLEAITGVLAIAVLLLVTNWFFHRVYWSQWIARFNRRRRALQGVFGLALLGLTSVYREGFETVLFVQNLQVSAGTRACLLGCGIGLAGTFAVGGLTFAAQRRLPYKRMLVATGVLIAVVLAVMTGTTVHVMQGLGWLPSTPTSFGVSLWTSRWFGIYATWEGIAAQAGALLVVVGSYVVARELQVRAPRRRAARARDLGPKGPSQDVAGRRARI